MAETSKVGKRGAVVIPAKLRRRFGLEEGMLVIAEEREDGILLRPAVAIPVESLLPRASGGVPSDERGRYRGLRAAPSRV